MTKPTDDSKSTPSTATSELPAAKDNAGGPDRLRETESEASGEQKADSTQLQHENDSVTVGDETAGDETAADEKTGDEKDTQPPVFNPPSLGKIKKTKKQSTAKPWLLWLVMTISVTALAVSGWLYYQQYLQQQAWQQLQQNNQRLQLEQQQLLAEARDKAEKSLRAANAAQSVSASNQAQSKRLAESLAATQQQVRLISGRKQQDWKLAEAEYLLRLAQFNISIEKNQSVAIQLLTTADHALSAVGDVTLTEIRSAIAADLQKLKAVPTIDTEGLIARLSALQQQLPALKLAALEYVPVAKELAEKSEQRSEQSEWKKAYQAFLKDFVTIKHHQSAVQPMMTAEQRYFLDAALSLKFERAKTALLTRRQSLYQLSLNEAAKLIDENFAANEMAGSVQSEIKQLSQLAIAPALPRRLESLDVLVTLNQQRLYQWLEQSGSDSKTQTDGGEQ